MELCRVSVYRWGKPFWSNDSNYVPFGKNDILRRFYVELHYVGVESVDIAKKRVAHRVSVGGHGIPEEDIERRYTETFNNLNEIISKCDRISFYDNTNEFECFAIIEGGTTVILVNDIPDWFEKVKDNQTS